MVDTKTRATRKQYGTVRFAEPGESAPDRAVAANDPRLSGGVGPTPTSASGRMLPPTLIFPIMSFGHDNDWVIYTPKLTLYYKKPGTGWIKVAHLMKNVSNSQAVFITPTAGDGTAEIATL